MTASPSSYLRSITKAAIREWPFTLGLLVLLIAHITYYGILDHEWQIAGPPLFIGIATLFFAEITREFIKRYQNKQ